MSPLEASKHSFGPLSTVTEQKSDYSEIGLSGLIDFPWKISVEWQGIIILDKDIFLLCKLQTLFRISWVSVSASAGRSQGLEEPDCKSCQKAKQLLCQFSILILCPSLSLSLTPSLFLNLSLSLSPFLPQGTHGLSSAWLLYHFLSQDLLSLFVYMCTGQLMPYTSQVHSFK